MSGVHQGIMIIMDELGPCRLLLLFVSQKKEEWPSLGLVIQPNLWEFATCVPKRTTKTPKSQSSKTLWNLALGSFHPISLQVHEVTPSFPPLHYRASSGLSLWLPRASWQHGPVCRDWGFSTAALGHLQILCLANSFPLPLGCSALQQSSSAQHGLCPSHQFPL